MEATHQPEGKDRHPHLEAPKLPERGGLVDSARLVTAVAGAVTAGAVLSGPVAAVLAGLVGLVLSAAVAARERQRDRH